MINSISNGEIGSSVRSKLNQVITAVQAMKIKPSNTSRTANTMLDDPHLVVTLPQDELVVVHFHLIFQLDASSGIKMNWSTTEQVSPGPFISYRHTMDALAPEYDYFTAFSDFAPTLGVGYHLMDGSIALSSGGDMALQWANNTGAGTLTLLAGSWVRVLRSS